MPDIFRGLPDSSKGLERARWLWYEREYCDAKYGMLSWKGARYWFRFSSYDHEEEAVRYEVYALTDEEARVLDDWHTQYCFLRPKVGAFANGSLALKEKIAQMQAFAATLPWVESAPPVAHFAVRDDGSD